MHRLALTVSFAVVALLFVAVLYFVASLDNASQQASAQSTGEAPLPAADDDDEGIPFVVVTTPAMREAATAYAEARAAAFAKPAAANAHHGKLRPIVVTVPECVEAFPDLGVDEAVRAKVHQLLGAEAWPEASPSDAAIPTTDDGLPVGFVLLIGTVPTPEERLGAADPALLDPEKHVPAFYRHCHVIDGAIQGLEDRWEHAPGDGPYVSRDEDDEVPQVPIGRLPFTEPEALRQYAAQIEAYERAPAPGDWRGRMTLLAGDPGFEQLGDRTRRLIEMAWELAILRSLDESFDVTLTYANPASPYCWPPPEFSNKVVEEINGGSLILNYIGHGWVDSVDRLTFNNRRYEVFTIRDAARVDTGDKPPYAAFFTCYTGAYDIEGPGLAEALIHNPRGPIGVFASSRISNEINFLLEVAFLELTTKERVPTIGEVALRTQRRMLTERLPYPPILMRQYNLNPHEGYTEAKRAHLWMYNLFGDPTVRLSYAAKLPTQGAVQVSQTEPVIGEPFRVDVSELPAEAVTVRARLEANRRTIVNAIEPLPLLAEAGESAVLDVMRRNHAAANNREVARTDVQLSRGTDSAELTLAVPSGSPAGAYVVKVDALDHAGRQVAHGYAIVQAADEAD